ncbi:MAG: CPBP family intramembrane metalloprotease domain-containing protein [Blastopirellula sp.]|nr:MAG: CPBP family intramembrane metalloprotease domain-containing protein [Blastopirellula sp.]
MRAINVKLILFRELRDQLRDRRTLFSVVVLPVLLYPLLGLLIMQVTQFRQQSTTELQIIGSDELPEFPVLVADNSFSEEVLPDGYRQDMFQITLEPKSGLLDDLEDSIQQSIKTGEFGVVIYFPPGFADRLKKYQERQASSSADEEGDVAEEMEFPQPRIFVNLAQDKSQSDFQRVKVVIHRWREKIIQQNLEAHDVPKEVTNPFVVNPVDLAEEPERRALLWSKIFPFIVVIWALTGAFYPAIDLCAGEKERGTLETLLSSPALRSEIVGGKLLAIMMFSIATSLLNLASMGLTAGLVMQQLEAGSGGALNIGPPPLWSIGWLLLALIPMSALFSALSLAVAALARSSKEGQYYLVPLLMINLPLVVLPILPGVTLNLGTSIIPVTGVLLLMKALMEDNYYEAMVFAVPVMAVTWFCIWLSIRWAIDQFNNESVLFRESERFDIRLWFSHTIRDRGPTPTFGAAVIAGLMLLMLRFFIVPIALSKLKILFPEGLGDAELTVMTMLSQFGFILIPILVFAYFTCRSPAATFRLVAPKWTTILMMVLLAIVVHPLSMALAGWIKQAFPMDSATKEQLEGFLAQVGDTSIPLLILLIAVLPAICEELAFRGFILSGLRHMGHKWAAICITAFLFGVTHGLLQQSIGAAILGVLIGYIAVQTSSIFPGMAYHFLHNSLMVLIPISLVLLTQQIDIDSDFILFGFYQFHVDVAFNLNLDWIVKVTLEGDDAGIQYAPWLVGLCAVIVVAIVVWLSKLQGALSAEEELQSALEHQHQH